MDFKKEMNERIESYDDDLNMNYNEWREKTKECLMDGIIGLVVDYVNSCREAMHSTIYIEKNSEKSEKELVKNIINNYEAMKEGYHRRKLSNLVNILNSMYNE